MDVLTAYHIFRGMHPSARPELPVWVSIGSEKNWPIMATALALISGDLEECRGPGACMDALDRGVTMVRGGQVDKATVFGAVDHVVKTKLES